MGLALNLYRLAASLRRSKTAIGETGSARPDRPPGPLVWLHTSVPGNRTLLEDLIAGLTDKMPDLWFLITSIDEPVTDLPDHCFTLALPADNPDEISEFLDHWQPGLLAWLGDALCPVLVTDTAARKIPLFLLEAEHTLDAEPQWSILSRLTGTTLRAFTKILAGDERAKSDLRRAGAAGPQIETIGVFERAHTVLSCIQTERDALASLLTARPVWLAAEVQPAEYEAVIDAHMFAMRRSHRYLLIIAPDDPDDGDSIAKLLTDRGLTFARRSLGHEPKSETQIYIADAQGEMGLWYRIAPVSFVGGTLSGNSQKAANPFDAATLGSAVLHGLETAAHGDEFRRLGRVNASVLVANTDDLANAVDRLLAPDKVAEMAHAAWNVCSTGAEATDHVIEMLAAELQKRGTLQ